MASLDISIPDDMREFVDLRSAETNHSTPTGYVRSLIREDQKRAAQERLEGLLLEGLENGDPVEMTAEDWAEIRGTARRRLAEKNKRWP